MRSASGGLIAYLPLVDAVYVADLLTITLANGGGTVRLTTYDVDLIVGGATYSSGPTLYRRDAITVAVGLVAEPIRVTISPASAALVAGVPWALAVQSGVFDGARVAVEKILMPSPGDTTLGAVNLFTGRVAQVEADRATVELTCTSDVELLEAPFPRNVYQPTCAHTLYDAGCALNKAFFTYGSTVRAGSTAKILNETTLTDPTGWYNLGTVTMTSGALTGQIRPVKAYTSGSPSTIELLRPFPTAPAPGDTMDVAPGCDKRQGTCDTKFTNIGRFRGEPFIPVPEQAR